MGEAEGITGTVGGAAGRGLGGRDLVRGRGYGVGLSFFPHLRRLL